jgi:maleate isomerase
MTIERFTYDLRPDHDATNLGLIVLQADERIEQDFRRLLPDQTRLFVTRVPSGLDVTPDTLQEMAGQIPSSARLLPGSIDFDAIGYGCTSGAAQIGPGDVAGLVKGAAHTQAVTEPVSALIAACAALGISRLAFLSPYVASVSDRLRDVLRVGGIETPVFGTFDESREATVARITPKSILDAALELSAQGGADGIFLSCTNLDTLDIIAPLEAQSGLPVLSSNLVLAWHMCRLGGAGPIRASGRLSRLDGS